MATEQQNVIGKIDCPVCGEQMPVKQNGRDTLNISCPWCGLSAYAKGGTEASRIVMGWIPEDATPAPASSQAPQPQKKAGIFGRDRSAE